MFLESAATSDSFWEGITQFNQGEYYACHDTLEAIWMRADIPEKPFFQGILQLAVALYHLSNENWQGAAILLGEGMHRLEPFEPTYRGIDVSALLDQAHQWQTQLQLVGPENVALMASALAQTNQAQSVTIGTETLSKWVISRVNSN
jgi:predicted metal-dependent hydrolase